MDIWRVNPDDTFTLFTPENIEEVPCECFFILFFLLFPYFCRLVRYAPSATIWNDHVYVLFGGRHEGWPEQKDGNFDPGHQNPWPSLNDIWKLNISGYEPGHKIEEVKEHVFVTPTRAHGWYGWIDGKRTLFGGYDVKQHIFFLSSINILF